jgi:hypothetical protein
MCRSGAESENAFDEADVLGEIGPCQPSNLVLCGLCALLRSFNRSFCGGKERKARLALIRRRLIAVYHANLKIVKAVRYSALA